MATQLTQDDLKIYPSQRLTDTPDGGGLMVGTPLTGADNELFAPISDVDRIMGSFDARLVYPGVLRNDTEPLYGAHFIISEPPQTPNVSYLCFRANGYGDSRAAIMPRIQAYSVPTIESRMTLLGKQLQGSRIIQAYQLPEAPLPIVGERYCLSTEAGGKVVLQQFSGGRQRPILRGAPLGGGFGCRQRHLASGQHFRALGAHEHRRNRLCRPIPGG